MLNFKEYITEMYSFFPKSVEEIERELTSFPIENRKEIMGIFSYLKSKVSKLEAPINIDLKIPGKINVSRQLQGVIDLKDITSAVKLNKVKMKYGNGSSGNRGANNRGNLFEGEFADALNAWWAGDQIRDASTLSAIEDLNKTYNLKKSKKITVEVVGGENTKRPLQFSGNKIVLDNPKGSGYDVGASLTDITLTTDDQKIYLSLKLGGTTTFFNVGVKTILTKKEIQSGQISNKNGLILLNAFGIDPLLFCEVFNGTLKKGVVDKKAKYNKTIISSLLQSGIGYNYHVIHKMGKTILSKKMDRAAMTKAATISSGITVYYGGKTGTGKRVDVEFSSPSYNFKINIRDTQGTDGYPTRMMCDFKHK